MSCLTCAHAALRDQSDEPRDRVLRRMAAMGLLNCSLSNLRAGFFPLMHVCPRYQPAAPDIAAARQAWAEQQNLLP